MNPHSKSHPHGRTYRHISIIISSSITTDSGDPLNVGRLGAASEGTGMDVVLHHLMIMQVANIKSIT